MSRSRALHLLLALLTMLGCDQPLTGPGRQPPFLAVVVFVDAPPGVNERGPYSFRVRELSGSLGVDTTFRATTADTTILPVPAATYRVDISGVPATCGVRDGTARAIVVPPNTNTSLVRFFITCTPGLTVTTGTDGITARPDYLVTAIGPDSVTFSSVIRANDTIRFSQMPAGTYDVTLRLVSSDCVVTNDGGESIRTTVRDRATTVVRFRIICSNPPRRPRIESLRASYHDGAVGYVLRVVDPDRDVLRSFFDITDCNRRSVLPGGGLLRVGLPLSPAVFRRDSALIVGAYDIPLADDALANRCILMWVDDEQGNITPIVEAPLPRRNALRAPRLDPFNAILNGTRSISVTADLSDPDGDLVGSFLVYLVRDGVLGPANGEPDRVLVTPGGQFGPRLSTELVVNVGFGAWNDYLGAILYGIDGAGNFTRTIDLDLFR